MLFLHISVVLPVQVDAYTVQRSKNQKAELILDCQQSKLPTSLRLCCRLRLKHIMFFLSLFFFFFPMRSFHFLCSPPTRLLRQQGGGYFGKIVDKHKLKEGITKEKPSVSTKRCIIDLLERLCDYGCVQRVTCSGPPPALRRGGSRP